MKLLIAIPSRSRSELLEKCVLPWLLPCLPGIGDASLAIFVEPQQHYEYSKVVDPTHLVDLPFSDKGNEFACDWIGHYAVENKFDLVLKLDDDVRGFVQRFSARKNLEKSQTIFLDMIEDCRPMFEKEQRLGGIGYPYAHQMWEVKKWLSVNSRLQTCYMVRASHMRTPYEHLQHWEDFYRFLRILNMNQLTLRYGLAGIECEPVGKTPGGCQDFDRASQAQKSMAYLNRMWPGIAWKRTDHSWGVEPDFKGTRSLYGAGLVNRLNATEVPAHE